MFKNVYIPYKGYWSSPFCEWQGALQNQHAVELAAATAKRFFESRGITPDIFDGIVFGTTIPQKMWFYDAPWFATLMGNPNISGPSRRPGVRHRHRFHQLCRDFCRSRKQLQCIGCYR